MSLPQRTTLREIARIHCPMCSAIWLASGAEKASRFRLEFGKFIGRCPECQRKVRLLEHGHA